MTNEEKIEIALTLTSSELQQVLSLRQEQEANEHREAIKASAPAGCVVHEIVSYYYGSHSEYGYGDKKFFVAIPEGSELPEMNIGYGSYSNSIEGLALLPVGSYVNWDGEWEPVSS